jgi:hypothetical protein
MVDFNNLSQRIEERQEKRRLKQKQDEEYLVTHTFCGMKNGCDRGHADEVLEVIVEDKIFKSVICDFHSYKLLSVNSVDILRMIDRKEIEGEWIDA